jgi:hypothetical protein
MGLLGCVATHAAICRFFGVEAAASAGQAAIVLPSLEVEYSPLVACAGGQARPARVDYPVKYQLPERPLLPFERVRYALEPWFDSLLGPFGIVADDEIEQVPLLQYPISVRSPSERGKQEIVVGWGLEHAAAVAHGLSQAVEALAHSFQKDDVALVCEFDETSWKRRALAYAVAHSEEMASQHYWAWVDLSQLPPGPARVLYALLKFQTQDSMRVQMQWSAAGDACIVRVLRAGAPWCTVAGADPLSALAEGLGQACSMFQLQKLPTVRFGRDLDLAGPDSDAQVDDWQDALVAAENAQERYAHFHLLAAPGFPPEVYCGYASLKRNAA